MKLCLIIGACLLAGVAEAHEFKAGFYRLAHRDHLEIKNVTATSLEFSLGNLTGTGPSLFVHGEEASGSLRLCELEGKATVAGNEATFATKAC